MEKYSLEIGNWGDWELVKDFSSLSLARRHGDRSYSQNEWRIIDRKDGEVVFENDPYAEIETQSKQELKRFEDNERWVNLYAERRVAENRRRQEQERVAEVSARRQAIQARRTRLRGFQFVGNEPDILEEQWWERQITRKRGNVAAEKVNWMKEGF
jgi:hypothetical protein